MSCQLQRRAPRIGVISLGCAKNLVDTEVMLGHLDRAGCQFVQDPSQAELILINTCGFIDAAREESIQAILEAAEYKKTGRLQRLVVAGCLVHRYREELQRSLPEVDAFIDLDEIETVVGRLGLEQAAEPAPRKPGLASDLPLLGARQPAGSSWNASSYLYDERTPRRLATPPWTAYVKIAEGCDHTCAFCAIPGFRGRFRSRRLASLVLEAQELARRGVREINLIAQDSSHYGRDLGLTEGLSQLLEGLAAVAGLRWVRLHYLYPNTVSEALVASMARLEPVVKYVDIPLQHAHPATLRRMRRGGSAETHLRLLGSFRLAMPDVALRSTMIVGFPGETEQEFQTLLDFVRQVRFDHLGVFRYSHEEGTPAYALQDDVPAPTKARRFRQLMEAQQQIVLEHNQRLVGRRVQVLVEGAHGDTDLLLVGRMSTQAPDVDGQVLLNDGTARPGEFVQVELTGTAGYDLVGAIVGRA